ncbi:MAG: fibrinogen-like YCDxxxxGGGW domain-containing protein [Myxococcota bacterium]
MRQGEIIWTALLLAAACGRDVDTIDAFGADGPAPAQTASGGAMEDVAESGSADESGDDTAAPDDSGGESGPTEDPPAGDSSGGPIPPPESCNDGLQNGEESDVDCGGSACTPCETGSACGSGADCFTGVCEGGACDIAFSCLEVKQGRPSATSATYTIYPDGGADPIDVWCDMESHGGGWTLVYSANGTSFDVANAVPQFNKASLPMLMENSGARYQQYAEHSEEMFVCTTGLSETPLYETRTFEYIPRLWDGTLDNAEIFLTGTNGTGDASANEYCADLVWGGCNLVHNGYAIFNAAFGSTHWGRWSGNTVYGPTGAELRCFSADDVQGSDQAWLWHFVR